MGAGKTTARQEGGSSGSKHGGREQRADARATKRAHPAVGTGGWRCTHLHAAWGRSPPPRGCACCPAGQLSRRTQPPGPAAGSRTAGSSSGSSWMPGGHSSWDAAARKTVAICGAAACTTACCSSIPAAQCQHPAASSAGRQAGTEPGRQAACSCALGLCPPTCFMNIWMRHFLKLRISLHTCPAGQGRGKGRGCEHA